MSPSPKLTQGLSDTTRAEAEAVIQALAPVEPDLASLADALGTISAQSIVPHRNILAWKGLYLSIYELPRRVVLVGSIDDVPELAGLPADNAGLLLVETDCPVVSTAESLPRGTQWRSLAEFGADLSAEDRLILTVALVNNLQPGKVLVFGSRAGWEMLARYGSALRSNTELFAAVASLPDLSAAGTLGTYLRVSLPVLSLLYGPDEQALHHIADLFRFTPGERSKLRDLQDWGQPPGFFSASGS